jgi:hypothetical protein
MLQCGPLSRGDDVSIRAYNGYGCEFTIDASGTILRGPQKSR